VGEVIDAIRTFFQNLADIGWEALGIGVGLHILRLLLRVPAWRNIVRAAYPEIRIPFRTILGAYVAGVGVNSILPARSGDVLKLYLVKHRIPETTYPTLTSTLLVETLLDTFVAGAILIWALTIGVLPSLNVIPDLPAIDWSWPLRHPRPAAAIAIVWIAVIVAVIVIAMRRVRAFRERVRQGFAILHDFRRYLREVAAWQALSWVCRAASVYFCLRAFHVDATARNAMLVLVVQSLSTLFPFTPGGVGTQQGLLVYVFDKAAPHISKSRLVSFSVGMHIATTLVNVVLGFAAIFLMLGTLRWRRVVDVKEESAGARL
jgi:uncharacterized protein (TIRG00374 family)